MRDELLGWGRQRHRHAHEHSRWHCYIHSSCYRHSDIGEHQYNYSDDCSHRDHTNGGNSYRHTGSDRDCTIDRNCDCTLDRDLDSTIDRDCHASDTHRYADDARYRDSNSSDSNSNVDTDTYTYSNRNSHANRYVELWDFKWGPLHLRRQCH
jgi:hypothetical protein